MTELDPLFLQSVSYDGEELRRIFSAMLAADHFTTTDDGGGVITAGALKVSANGTPNMSVNVAAGLALVKGTEAGANGYYLAGNTATLNRTIAAADATNPRRDIVYLRIRDSVYSGANNDAPIGVQTGTPAASPSDPAIPANAIALARVAVAAGATSITSGNITDLRTASRLWSRPRGLVAAPAKMTADSGSITAVTDLPGLSIAFTAATGRRYRAHLHIPSIFQSTGGNKTVDIVDSVGTQYGQTFVAGLANSNNTEHDVFAYFDGTGGSLTLKGRVAANNAVVVDNSATAPSILVIEDIGGFLV